jgi:tetratricopeptide (TPR) repeat protein
MPLGPRFAEELTSALSLRRMTEGLRILAGAEAGLGELGPNTPDAARLLLLIAQWVDVGYRDHRLIDALLERFPLGCRPKMLVEDYLSLIMVEAFRDLAASELDSAVDKLDLVLRSGRDLANSSHQALAHFWKGRAHRKKGEYETSLKHIVQAREMAQADHDEIFTAVIQIQESWLLFQKGMAKDAVMLLDRAESILKSTDQYVALGNIESARGRIVRRSGEYTRALEHFSSAAEIYARRDPNHVNLARTLVNAAYVRRLLALQLRKRIDIQAHAGRMRNSPSREAREARESPLVRYQRLWHEAVDALTRAREIYALHAHFDGIGKVVLNLGYLHLDRGDVEHASLEAIEAYAIGLKKSDHILMARARILEAAIENAHVEEQTGEDVDVAVHANQARQYSEEALRLAESTQNRRLLAGACIARGMTAANDFFQDWDSARKYATQATGLIGPGENDHLVEDLASLKSRVVQASGINDMLRGWSEGIVGNKTFQEITEEFAEIVIPKVWMREDRKISRVATSLSISPKKVRRILRNSGSFGRH